MKLRKAKQKEIIEFIKRQLERDNYEVTVSLHQRAILENIYPFSWNVFCKEKKINPKILMDKHEISVRRVKSNGRC